MKTLRIGTRGSDLALWQSRWVVSELQKVHTDISFEEVILTTHGDVTQNQPADATDTQVGWFTGVLEKALLEETIDFAVHSCKDLPSGGSEELIIAAVPPRVVAHDVIVTAFPIDLESLPATSKIGTSSPRRIAQLQHFIHIKGVAIRGNVPTRVAKVTSGELDGVVLAAAGLHRLSLQVPHTIDLPVDRFVPAPRQGALAVQSRRDGETQKLLSVLDHAPSHRAVEAERSLLAGLAAGCQTPVGAIATVDGNTISLHGQLFSDDFQHVVEATLQGYNPTEVGELLARQLANDLAAK